MLPYVKILGIGGFAQHLRGGGRIRWLDVSFWNFYPICTFLGDASMKPVPYRPVLAACMLSASLEAAAMPIVESGKTVERADFSLNFDYLFSGLDLDSYEESGVWVTAPGLAQVDAPLFYGDSRSSGFYFAGANHGVTTVRGVNDEVFGAVDFMLGNGWATSTSYLRYATYLNGALRGTGVALLDSATVRISELGGFDELRLNTHHAMPAEFGGYQALALDDMHLQLWSPTAGVPEPGQLLLIGTGLMALCTVRRRRAASATLGS